MSPPPGEHETTSGGDPHRTIPTPFLTKTFQLVDDQAIDDVISWNDDGSSFVVWNPTVFARDLLPKYFKHNNFSSFVRQLNTYGFRKVIPDRWEFSNDFFRKGEKQLLLDIQRRKLSHAAAAASPPQPSPVIGPTVVLPPLNPPLSSSNSEEEQVISGYSSASVAGQASGGGGGTSVELSDENDRLRKENVQLTKELTDMKHLCNNIYSMVLTYSPEGGGHASGSSSGSGSGQSVRPVDIPTVKQFFRMEEAASARLFGVAIGSKRGRREGEGSSENENRPGGGYAVKTEPNDCCEIMDVDSDDSDDRHSLTLRMGASR